MDNLKIKMSKFLYQCTFYLFFLNLILCSEFPERECCDPIYPMPPDPEPIPPALPTTTLSSPSIIPTGRSGPNIKTAIAILNCILARQLCFEDPSCSAILEIIPRVCGPVPVSCSTVTVTKCQAALRTLQAFPFFRPTCLCKEPGLDPDCNYFRDFLFDHPCGFVLKKEKDPYPIDALPTCNHALSVCQQERKCIKLFEDFKSYCKVRDNRCRTEDRDSCHEAWTNLRLSPMFGCICPNNHMKRRCDRIFSMVNHNPCVDDLTFALDMVSDTESNSINSNFNSTKENRTNFSTYPHFLFPSKQIPLALASHTPETMDHLQINNLHSKNVSKQNHINKSTNLEHELKKNITMHHWHNNINNKNYNYNINNDNSNYNYINNYNFTKNHDKNQFENDMDVIENARSNGNNLVLLDENLTPVETPLLPPPSTYYTHQHNTAIYPYNLTAAQTTAIGGGAMPTLNNFLIDSSNNGENQNGLLIYPETTELTGIPYQSTCNIALETCREDTTCLSSLHSVLLHCELYRCNRNACMESLQKFYKNLYDDLSLDVAFCLCRKPLGHHDKCMIAQEKLHPTCAQRPENYHTHNGIPYHHAPSCNAVVDVCREDEYCSKKLEIFEQACSIDSITNKCAGKTSGCRTALVAILGTTLRTTCSCQGTELQQHYDCLGWQKLLWLNPCVVEAQRDFHIKRLIELGIFTTTSPITPSTSSMLHQPTYRSSDLAIESNYIDLPDLISETLMQNGNEIVGSVNENDDKGSEEQLLILLTGDTSETETTISTTTVSEPQPTIQPTTKITTTITFTQAFTTLVGARTTAVPIRYCVVQRPYQIDQYIPEGQSKRISSEDPECSELCTCGNSGEPLALSCHVLCVPLAPCRTVLAYYNHAAPAYQAFRGRCLCYSGRFICMRPPPDDYILTAGVYLLLGYSSTDESMLRPHTNLGVQDSVRALQHYLYTNINNHTSCTLTLFNITDENVIMSARLSHDIKSKSDELFRKEKTFCTSLLETISHHINSQQNEFFSHPLLSIFKMAEVRVIWPEINSSVMQSRWHINSLYYLTLIPVIHWIYQIKFINLT